MKLRTISLQPFSSIWYRNFLFTFVVFLFYPSNGDGLKMELPTKGHFRKNNKVCINHQLVHYLSLF